MGGRGEKALEKAGIGVGWNSGVDTAKIERRRFLAEKECIYSS